MIDILRACAVKFRFGYTKHVTINLIVQKCIQCCFFLSVQQELKSEKNIYIIIKMQATNQENRFSGNENIQMCDLC